MSRDLLRPYGARPNVGKPSRQAGRVEVLLGSYTLMLWHSLGTALRTFISIIAGIVGRLWSASLRPAHEEGR